MSQLVACNLFFSNAYHWLRSARPTSAGSDLWAAAWMIALEVKLETLCFFTWVSVKRTTATDTVSINNWVARLIQMNPKAIQHVVGIFLTQKQKAMLKTKKKSNTAGVEWGGRLLCVYWKNPYNHRRKLNWLLGVVYLYTKKPVSEERFILMYWTATLGSYYTWVFVCVWGRFEHESYRGGSISVRMHPCCFCNLSPACFLQCH